MSDPFDWNDVEILKDETVYKGFLRLRKLTLRHRLFKGGWSAPVTRELLERHQAVGVLLYDPARDTVALIEQFRVGTLLARKRTPWLVELVAGLIDTAESPEAVARREAQEEAGCSINTLIKISEYYSSPGGSSEYFYLYCGLCDLNGVGGIHGLEVENEDIKVHLLSFDEAWEWQQSGRICNAHTLIAMQWLMLNRPGLRDTTAQR